MKVGIVVSGFVRKFRNTYENYSDVIKILESFGFETETYFSIWNTVGCHTSPKRGFVGVSPKNDTWVDDKRLGEDNLVDLVTKYKAKVFCMDSFRRWREENQGKIEEVCKKWGKQKDFHYILNSCFAQSYLLSDAVKLSYGCDMLFRYRTDIRFDLDRFADKFPKTLNGFCTPFYSNGHIVDNCWFLSTNHKDLMGDFYDYLFTLERPELDAKGNVSIESILGKYLENSGVKVLVSNFWCKGEREILRMVER